MMYDGTIDKSIKEEARRVLELPDCGRETKTLCVETVSRILSAIEEKRIPFDDEVKEILIKYDIQNECQYFQAKKALAEVSVTLDLEAETLIKQLMKKYNTNKDI